MKKLTAILLSCLLLLSLCACGRSASQNSASAPMAAAGDYYAPADARESDYGGFAMAEEAPMPAPEAAPKTEAPLDAPDVDPEKIIYSASVTVETTDFDAAAAALQALIERCGGFVESSSLNGNNYYSQARGYASSRSASYTLRVPSARFGELMGSLSELGNVPYSHTYTENISAQYYDVDARLNACRTQEARLLEMMEQAETVSDLIEIEDRLAELRYQIESLQATLKNWDRQVSYSTINLSLNEVTIYTPQEEPGYFAQLWESIEDGFYGAGELFKGLIQAIVTLLPLIVIALVLLVILRPVIKKRRAARKAKKEAAGSDSKQK